MISKKKNIFKNILLILLILILLMLLLAVFRYNGYVEVFKNIINGKKNEKHIISGISINGISLNYDFATSTYYLPIKLDENKEEKLNIEINSDYNIKSKIQDKEFKKQIEISEVLSYDKEFEIDIETWLYEKSYIIKFTNLPSISLKFNEENIDFDYIYSEFLITDPMYEENEAKYQYYDDAEVRYRGGSTADFFKKSYRVKLEKEVDFGILGMKKSKTWILDALATDLSCLRTKVASDIWNVMNEDLSEEKYAQLNAKYIELYINGEYRGLYLLKETVDEELLNLKDTGVLLKGVNWEKINFDNYQNVEEEIFGPFEIKYPENVKEYPNAWKNILSKLEKYYRGYTSYDVMEKAFYKENFINHKIFLLITQALDNYEYKNIYYSIIDNKEETKVLITPWDLDLTFGMLWDNEANGFSEQYDRVREIVKPFGVVSDNKTSQYYKDRWEYLSKAVLEKEEINKLIDENYQYLMKARALERENNKYYNTDVEEEKEEIKKWYDKRFNVIDEYIRAL